MDNSSHTASIHILDDDSLLNIFYLYRPVVIFDGKKYEDQDQGDLEGRDYGGARIPERWWYKPAQVCQRWRKIILGSASYLDLCLVCTYGTPVADMLAHSPPLPLVIDFFRTHWEITREAEEGIILALERRDRVRRVRLLLPDRNMRNLFMSIEEEFPALECLIMRLDEANEMAYEIAGLQAPHLRNLILRGFILLIGSPLLATAVGLVTLGLDMSRNDFFRPKILLQILQSISSMPQLETLFLFLPRRDVGVAPSPVTQRVALPNLRRLVLEGVGEFIEAVVCRIATPLIETLDIRFSDRANMFFVPSLLQFVNTTENLKFDCARFVLFGEGIRVDLYTCTEARTHSSSLSIYIAGDHLYSQVYSMAKIFDSSIDSSQIFSTVEHLTLEYRVHRSTYKRYDEVNDIRWRKVFRLFSNAKTLHVDDGFAKEFFHTFLPESPDDGELALDLLPRLEELTYCRWLRSDDTEFTSFIDYARQNAGRLVTLFNPSLRHVSLLSRRLTPLAFTSPFSMSFDVIAGSIEKHAE